MASHHWARELKRLRRPVGWRFSPRAKGSKPFPERGKFAAARQRRRLAEKG